MPPVRGPFETSPNLLATPSVFSPTTAEISRQPASPDEVGALLRRIADLERQVAEGAASAELGRLIRFAVENATDVILWIKPDARFAYVNQTACRILGYTREEISRLRLFDIDPTVKPELWPRAWARVQRRGAYNFEAVLRRRNGELIPVEVANYYLDYREQQLCCSIVRDISERKKSEAELRQAKEAADKANQAKSRFLAATGHDLRQPLQSSRLLHYALSRTVTDPAVKDIVDDLGHALALMAGMLDSLLDISRLDSGAVTPKIAEFAAQEVLRRVWRTLKAEAGKASIDVHLVPTSAIIRSDHVLLGRALENLVANALRHARARNVLIGCRRRGHELALEVWDNGIGIAADKLQTIFEEYVQINAPAATDQSRGLGLGLSIVRCIANKLGHRIEVTSEVGRYSRFAIVVPLAAAPVELDREAASDLAGRTVVMIDNDQTVAKAYERVLAGWGMNVINVAAAAEAAAAARRRNLTPDIVIADYKLAPSRTGIDEIWRMRRNFGAALACILITNDASPEISKAAAAIGVPVLYKPVESAALQSLVRRLLSDRARGGGTAAE
jgi:PAS domain S-box-containing protein